LLGHGVTIEVGWTQFRRGVSVKLQPAKTHKRTLVSNIYRLLLSKNHPFIM